MYVKGSLFLDVALCYQLVYTRFSNFCFGFEFLYDSNISSFNSKGPIYGLSFLPVVLRFSTCIYKFV